MKKFSLVVALIIFFFFLFGIIEAYADSMASDYMVEIGKNFYMQGCVEAALHEFKKALMIDPDNKEAIDYIRLLQGPEQAPPLIKMQKETKPIVKEKILPTTPVKKDYFEPEINLKEKEMNKAVSMEEALRKFEEEVPVKQTPVLELIHRKGEIHLFVNGKEVSLDNPILVKEGKVFLPFKDIASKLHFGLIDLREGNFKIISPEGQSQEIKVFFMDEKPVIRENELKQYFSVDAYFDDIKKEYHILTKYAPSFEAYELEKSEEELKKEKVVEELKKKATTVSEKPSTIPEAARPSVQLKGNATYNYIKYHMFPSYHSLLYSLSGRVYDFGLRYETNYKDINGEFGHDYTYLDLTKPDLFIGLFDQSISLSPLRLQSNSFNGLKIIKDWEKSKTTFVAGKAENALSGSSGLVKYLGRIYGLKENFSPLEWLDLGGALFYLENEAEVSNLAGTTSFPRENLVTFAEAALKLPNDLTVSTQIAQCNYEPDNALDQTLRDLDWRVNSEIKKERYRIGFNYEFVGDQYASLGNPLSYQDFSGWNLYEDYKVTDSWQLAGSLMQYNNNVADDPNKATQDNLGFSLSSYHRLTKQQGLNLTYSHFNSETSSSRDPNTTAVTDLYRFDYSLPFFFGSRALVGYQIFRSDFSDPNSIDYFQHGPNLSLLKSFGKGSSWYLSHQFSNTNYKVGADNDNSNTSFNLNHTLNDLISLYFNTNYSRDKTGELKGSNTLSASSGFNYRIFPDTVLNCEYNIGSYNLNTEKHKWPSNWSIMTRISQGFDFSTPANFGIIQGVVFNDINGNARIDNDEQGIEEVRLYLDDRRETFTDKTGHFKFSYVTPERQKVYLDLGSLPPDWTIKEVVQEVDVKPRRKTYVNFVVVKASLIQGKVFIDENSDSVYQENEEPLENIAIIMMPGEQFRRTDQEGDFKFDNLLPGKYKVRLNPKDIPIGYELVSWQEIEVDLPIGKKVKGINFILRLKPTAIKKF